MTSESRGASLHLIWAPLRFVLLGAIALTTLILFPSAADAHPQFARIYDVPCSTCHVTITRRNEFGDAFRRNGFHWPGAEEGIDERVRDKTSVEMRGVSLLDGLIPKTAPLGLSATLNGSWTDNPDAVDPLTLGSPSLRILFGAPLGEHVSFLGTWTGGTNPPNEAYIHIAKWFGRPELNLRAGLLEPSTTLFKKNEALLGRYLSNGPLQGYDVAESRVGVELHGTAFERTSWSVGVAQDGGAGTGPVISYQVGGKIGGTDWLGQEPDIDFDAPESILDDLRLTMSHWGLFTVVHDPSTGLDEANIVRLGLDLKLGFFDGHLWGGAMLGLDRDLAKARDAQSLTVFGEVGYLVTSWLMPVYLYQYQDAASFERQLQTHDVGFTLLLLESLRARAMFSFTDDAIANEVMDFQLFIAL